MKHSQKSAIAIAMSLGLGVAAFAGYRNLSITNHAAGIADPASEISSTAHDYLNANWALFTDNNPALPAANDESTDVASQYFNANWRFNTASRSGPPKTDTEIADDYFNSNWAAFER